MTDERAIVRASSQPTPDPRRSGVGQSDSPWREDAFGVVIGINEYVDPKIPNLRFARADAEALYQLLTDPAVGRFKPDNVTLLVDSQATERNIRSAIGTQLPRRAGKDSTVLIYYAGHGAPVIDPRAKSMDGLEKYLVPNDAEADDLRASAIAMESVQQYFSWLDASQVICFLDSCYSGTAGGRSFDRLGFQTRAMLSDEFLDSLASEGRFVVTACATNEVSIESPKWGHGIFTHYLLEGLKGAADADRNGKVTIDELYEYIYKNVERDARMLGGSMNPVKKGSVRGTIYLTEYEIKTSAEPADEPAPIVNARPAPAQPSARPAPAPAGAQRSPESATNGPVPARSRRLVYFAGAIAAVVAAIVFWPKASPSSDSAVVASPSSSGSPNNSALKAPVSASQNPPLASQSGDTARSVPPTTTATRSVPPTTTAAPSIQNARQPARFNANAQGGSGARVAPASGPAPLTTVKVYPLDFAKDVPTNSVVTLRFPELSVGDRIDLSTLVHNVILMVNRGGSVPMWARTAGDDVVVRPMNSLVAGSTQYTVQVEPGIKSVAGRRWSATRLSSFTTVQSATTQDSPPSVDENAVVSIDIQPAPAVLAPASRQLFTAVARSARSDVLLGEAAFWSSSNASVATIDATGLATAIGPGTTVISVAVEGRKTTAVLTVRQ